MKQILPNFNEPLLITITKIGALITTAIGFIAIVIFIPAGGHPPGIVFVPIVLGVWAAIMVALTLVYYSLKLVAKASNITSDEHSPYSLSIIVSSVYFLYLLLDSAYRIMPYAIYATPNDTIDKIITPLIAFLVLAGTILQKGWARLLTVVILLLPIILVLYSLIIAGVSFGELGFAQVKLLITTFTSIWIIYDYLSNEKVKLYFSR